MAHIFVTETGADRIARAKLKLINALRPHLYDEDIEAAIFDALDLVVEAAVAETKGTHIPRDLGERLQRLEDRLPD